MMTIDKAIEILESRIKSPFTRANPDTKDAMSLAIEALKWIKAGRSEGCYQCPPTLPGETDA